MKKGTLLGSHFFNSWFPWEGRQWAYPKRSEGSSTKAMILQARSASSLIQQERQKGDQRL